MKYIGWQELTTLELDNEYPFVTTNKIKKTSK